MCSVAREMRSGCSIPSVSMSSRNARSNFFVYSPIGTAALVGVADDLVVHVGNVHDVHQLESALAQVAAQHVHGDKRAEITDVAVVVNRGPAGVEANRLAVGRSKFFNPAAKRVE